MVNSWRFQAFFWFEKAIGVDLQKQRSFGFQLATADKLGRLLQVLSRGTITCHPTKRESFQKCRVGDLVFGTARKIGKGDKFGKFMSKLDRLFIHKMFPTLEVILTIKRTVPWNC